VSDNESCQNSRMRREDNWRPKLGRTARDAVRQARRTLRLLMEPCVHGCSQAVAKAITGSRITTAMRPTSR